MLFKIIASHLFGLLFLVIFTQQMYITPYQYILERKIEHAKILIQQQKITITDIAFKMGFSSYVNFCNAFKKITSKTPSNFRTFYSNLRPVA